MAEHATLARPYAEAVFKLAKETDSFAQWADMLNFLSMAVQDPRVTALCTNPLVEKKSQTGLLLDVGGERLNVQGQNLVKLLTDNGKLTIIPEIAAQYETLKAQHEGYITVELTSTYAVQPEQKEGLAASLKRRLGKEVEINVSLDEKLLGGWVIRAGDQVIDLSVRGRLQQLAAELSS
ncbi:MAG: F0F1 ATP synthase subunit delta [Gammaproteobacteria bacterium]|nr:F0F1 ATP synthase subunit delta [Gammaproteobacteria bacterium]